MTIRMEGDSTEGATGQAWECSIEAVPQDQPFRPHRATRRPRIVGVQTALVTGPAGEEIHCDELGRVKVQFHWDRQRTLDEKTSCWIRVTQGHTTGSVMIPRIGWEVLVEFLEGDPDRPVCLGRVYNPLAPPDYVLPAQKTVSGLRSNSSPGAGGVNEVLFDDAAGSELLYMSSPHNVVFNVENDEMHKVVKNQTRSVGGSARFTVGGSENIAVKGAVDSSVTGAHSVTVGSRDLKVTGEIKEETTADVSITVGAAEMVQVGNPATAVLEIIASEAMAAATGAVAGAASRAEAAVLGPIAPALNAARGALGTAAQLAGPAAALFGGGSPAVAALGAAAGGASNAAGAASAGAIAAGVAQSMVGQGAAAAVAQAVSGAAGSGTWGTTVGGAVDETIGALCVHNSTYGFTMGIGGASTETIGAARAGIYTGGYCESVGAAKTEKVGVYMVKAPKGIAVDAKGAIALTIAKQTQKIGGNYSLTAKTVGAMTVSKADLKGSTVTFKCGTAEVVVSGSGIELAGVAGVTIKATGKLKLTSPNIKAV
ncbi:MAG: type VI secretion system tip protein VgrG [Phycisphaerales bacterium]|nr:type VI secretion system tip protein VgrG [Phycisphaerales bacterium]